MASLIDNNGHWAVIFSRGKRQKKISLHLPYNQYTRKTATIMKNKMEAEFAMGLFDPWQEKVKDSTLKEAFRLFKKEKQYITQTSIYQNAVDSLFEFNKWSSLYQVTANGCLKWHKQAAIANSTKRTYLNHIKIFLRWCVKKKHLDQNPLIDVKFPKLEQPVPDAFTQEQLRQVISALETYYQENKKYISGREDYYMIHIVRFAVYTGCRLGEILNLKWADINREMRTIYIRNTKTRETGLLPVHDALADLLDLIPKVGEYVHTRDGARLDERRVSKRFKFACRLAGVPEGLHFHSLRHTAGYWMANSGMSVEMIRNILRHKSITMTQRYIRVDHSGTIPRLNQVYTNI